VEVEIRFASAPGGYRKARLSPEPGAWCPPPPTDGKGADLCLLSFQGGRPETAVVATLQAMPFETEFEVRASGYPADWNEKARSPQVDVAVGQILGVDG
jgi:hypothetical protein